MREYYEALAAHAGELGLSFGEDEPSGGPGGTGRRPAPPTRPSPACAPRSPTWPSARGGCARLSSRCEALRGAKSASRWRLFDLRPAILAAAESLGSRLRGPATLVVDGYTAPVRASPVHLERLFVHLFENALDAMDGRGEVRVTLRTDGEFAEVWVDDRGPGIPEEALPRLFDPFFTTKEVGAGDRPRPLDSRRHRPSLRRRDRGRESPRRRRSLPGAHPARAHHPVGSSRRRAIALAYNPRRSRPARPPAGRLGGHHHASPPDGIFPAGACAHRGLRRPQPAQRARPRRLVLAITPADPVINADMTHAVNLAFQATQDGADVTAATTFRVTNNALGSFHGATFTSAPPAPPAGRPSPPPSVTTASAPRSPCRSRRR